MLVMGGMGDQNNALSITQIVMPGSSTRYGPQMRKRVFGHCSSSLQDKVMVTGGRRHKQLGGSDVAEILHVESGHWEVVGKMNHPRYQHTCTTVWLKQHGLGGDIFNGGLVDNTSVLSMVVAGGEHYHSYNIYQVANKEK